MFNYSGFKSFIPGLFALLGGAMLLGAWTLAVRLPRINKDIIYYLNLSFWIPALVIVLLYCARSHFNRRAKIRCALVLLLFVVSLLPVNANTFQNPSAQTLSVAGTFMLLLGLSGWKRIHPWLAGFARIISRQREISSRLFICFFFSLFLGAAVAISWYCFNFLPVYTDSMAQYVHAKFVASGNLYGIPGHPMPDFFPVWLMVHAKLWYSQYPPMHQTLLGILYYFDMPWLLSPLAGALTLVLIYAIARRAYNETTARLATLLTLLCQFMLVLSSEFMNHVTTLFFGTLLIFSYLRMLDALPTGHKRTIHLWAMAAGLSAGAAFLTRPLTAVGLTLPFALHAGYSLIKNRRNYLKPCLLMAAGGLFGVALQLWYNKHTTGEWLTHAYTRYHANSVGIAMGFHKDGTMLKTLAKIHGDWVLLNVMLFEWSLPCCLFMMLACMLPIKNRTTRLLVGVVVSHTLVNMLNQFYSTVFGPRYMTEASSAIIILSAVGIMRLPLLLKLSGQPLPKGRALHGMIATVMLAIFASGIIYRVPNNLRIYSRYMDSNMPLYHSLLEQAQKPALVFLGRGDKNDPAGKFRQMTWTYPPTEDSPVIFAYDRGDERNRKLIEYYPHRQVYVESNGKLTPAGTMTEKKP